MALPNGVLRLQPKGGQGYHNGYVCLPLEPFKCVFPVQKLMLVLYLFCRVKSVMGNLDGRRNFPRLSIGTFFFLVRLEHDSIILCFLSEASGVFVDILVRHWSSTWKHGYESFPSSEV